MTLGLSLITITDHSLIVPIINHHGYRSLLKSEIPLNLYSSKKGYISYIVISPLKIPLNLYFPYMEVSIVMGVPPKSMVYNRKSHLEMDDDWGYPHDYGKPPYTYILHHPQLVTPLDPTALCETAAVQHRRGGHRGKHPGRRVPGASWPTAMFMGLCIVSGII